MNVKPATVADIPAIQSLFAEAIHWQRMKGMPTFADLSAAFFAEEINKGAVFLAEADDQILGTISLYEADEKLWDGDPDTAFYIHRLISRRGAAGRGFGAALIEWSHQRAIAFGKKWLRVDCWANNEALCRFYESQGFQRVRRKDTGQNADLPEHYQNIILQLFQMPAKLS